MENNTLFIILSFTLPFLMTTLGSGTIFFFHKQSKLISLLTIGLAAGIMLSASFWSLLLPALEDASSSWGNFAFIPIAAGFLIGCIFMVILGQISNIFFKKSEKSQHKRVFKLFTAITVHNIPEGLSVGFAVGTAVASSSPTVLPFMFALGIALQNLPEGLATALPIYSCINNKRKSFLLGTLSGAVEPLFAIVGFFLAASITSLMPWLLAFSAGSMIFVILQELLPEIHSESSLGTWAFVVGFILMMLLDICL